VVRGQARAAAAAVLAAASCLATGCGTTSALCVAGAPDGDASARLTGGSVPGATYVTARVYAPLAHGRPLTGIRSATPVVGPAASAALALTDASGRSCAAEADEGGSAVFTGVTPGTFRLTVCPPAERTDLSPLVVVQTRDDATVGVQVLGVLPLAGAAADGPVAACAAARTVPIGGDLDIWASTGASGSDPSASGIAWVVKTKTDARLELDEATGWHAILRAGSRRGAAIVEAQWGSSSAECVVAVR